jgi:hypothetical protein
MEELGGILVLKAGDLNHAVQFMAQHPALKYGSIRGSASAGLERNDEAERAAAARGYLAMRAATTEETMRELMAPEGSKYRRGGRQNLKGIK